MGACPPGGRRGAEGLAGRGRGKFPRRIVAALVGTVQLVSERQLEDAVELLIERQKLIVEGAGAAGIAALMAEPERFRRRKVGIVLTGGNNPARLPSSPLPPGPVRAAQPVRPR